MYLYPIYPQSHPKASSGEAPASSCLEEPLPDALTSGFVPSTPFAKKVKLSKTRELKKKLNLLVCLLINEFNMLTLLVILL